MSRRFPYFHPLDRDGVGIVEQRLVAGDPQLRPIGILFEDDYRSSISALIRSGWWGRRYEPLITVHARIRKSSRPAATNAAMRRLVCSPASIWLSMGFQTYDGTWCSRSAR